MASSGSLVEEDDLDAVVAQPFAAAILEARLGLAIAGGLHSPRGDAALKEEVSDSLSP